MQPEEKLLLACTRPAFTTIYQQRVRHLCCQEKIRWDVVYTMAEQHGVAPLIYANLQRCDLSTLGVPSQVISQFRRSCARNVATKAHIADKLTEVLAFLNQRSIDVMLIKGAALDTVVYDQSWYTTFNDVDLVLKPSGANTCEQYDAEIKEFFLHFPGFEYEYYKHHDIVMNDVLPVNFKLIWNDAIRIECRGHHAWVMSPEDMLISVCINSCRKRFFRLKALADICAVIDAYPDLSWTKLVQKAKLYDCAPIIYTALFIAEMTVGCDLPEQLLSRLNINPIRAGVIQFLSRSMSLAAFTSLMSGTIVLDRSLDWSLLLPYTTFRAYQIWRRIIFVLLSRKNKG